MGCPHPVQFVAINFVATILRRPPPHRIYLIVLSTAAVTVVFVWLPSLCPAPGSRHHGPCALCFPIPAWLPALSPGLAYYLHHDCRAAKVSPRWCYDFDAGSRMAKSATANTPAPHTTAPPGSQTQTLTQTHTHTQLPTDPARPVVSRSEALLRRPQATDPPAHAVDAEQSTQ